MLTNLAVRLHVVQSLQRSLKRFPPGLPLAEQYEKAVTLCLLKTREAVNPTFLRADVLRDARRILARAEQRHPQQSLDAQGDDEQGPLMEPALSPSLDEHITASEVLGYLERKLGALKSGVECLEGLLRGETVPESAERLGISERRVKYLRHVARQLATGLLGGEP